MLRERGFEREVRGIVKRVRNFFRVRCAEHPAIDPAARAYGWMSETARADLERLNTQLPRDAVIGTSDQMAGAVMLYAQRDIFRPGAMVGGETEFMKFVAAVQTRPIYFLGEWNCPATANAGERLPQWVENFAVGNRGVEVRDLPYECAQKIWEVQR
ncbi:MAG: hypothetical protein HY741_06290 [Chloroflexi bacterium]|nr:hypothetical protein [Chloroflexota bacterium]